jgi:hypothetical protein
LKPSAGRTSRSSPEEARLAIERFLAASKQPVVLETGDAPIPIVQDNYSLAWQSGYLTLEIWNDERNLSRRITGISSQTRGRLELTIERFGKRTGTLALIDTAASQDLTRRASRLTYRELFRRALLRQFAGWRLAELTTEPDLEHSLSPSYPRALVRTGTTGWAAIGAGPESDADGVLTFGLIWLDYLRTRERRLTMEGLAIFLPAGRERTTCLRLRYLNPRAGQFAVFAQGEDGGEDRVDLADYGNLETHLDRCTRAQPDSSTDLEGWVSRIAAEAPIEQIPRSDGSLSLRLRGLEFARVHDQSFMYGLETRRPATASNLGEIIALAQGIERFRSPDAGDLRNLLYARNPEGWLESQVRAHIQEIDATLNPEPIYGQVPAFTGGDRDVIDLLAADHRGRLAVIELKASEDVHLPMQALDYWLRVKWHAERGEFTPNGYFPGAALRAEAPRLLLVAPALDFHPSNETILRYFAPEIEVERIGVGLEWRKRLAVMFRYGTRG